MISVSLAPGVVLLVLLAFWYRSYQTADGVEWTVNRGGGSIAVDLGSSSGCTEFCIVFIRQIDRDLRGPREGTFCPS